MKRFGGTKTLAKTSYFWGVNSSYTGNCIFSVPGVSDTLLLKHGGPRIMTFMIYLSDVEAGGHTAFPQTNISVKPNRGTSYQIIDYYQISTHN